MLRKVNSKKDSYTRFKDQTLSRHLCRNSKKKAMPLAKSADEFLGDGYCPAYRKKFDTYGTISAVIIDGKLNRRLTIQNL